MRVGRVADGVEVCRLDLLRDRPAAALADRVVVDGADGRDLGRGAREEDLVGEVERLARQRLLADLEAIARAIVITVSRVMPGRMDIVVVGV